MEKEAEDLFKVLLQLKAHDRLASNDKRLRHD